MLTFKPSREGSTLTVEVADTDGNFRHRVRYELVGRNGEIEDAKRDIAEMIKSRLESGQIGVKPENKWSGGELNDQTMVWTS